MIRLLAEEGVDQAVAYVFRGLPDSDYKLESSLNRLGHTDAQKIRVIEDHLVNSFRKRRRG
jgi:hypothetical protein